MKYQVQENCLTIFLPRELDHHNAEKIRIKSDRLIEKHHIKCVIFDFGETNFMDSSGIGLVMGRYKTINEVGGELAIVNTSPQIGKVMRLAGMERLAKIGMEEITNEVGK